jgi:membrane associated rhomboid family serine protease
VRFWLVYLIGGIVGNLFFLILGPSNAIAIGASGAVFAIGGALTVLRPNLRVYIIPIPVPIPLWVAIIGSFAILSFIPNVAWQAHLGGFIVGAIAGGFSRR